MQKITAKKRKDLENEMLFVFGEKLQALPSKARKLLVDDLVSAFESRLSVFNRVESALNFSVQVEGKVECETL